MEINKPVATIVIAVINLVLIFLFVIPKYQELKSSAVALHEKQAQYEGKSAYFQKIAVLSESIESRKETLDKIDSALPSHVAFAPLVYFLQRKGAETGLIIKSITFAQGVADASQKPVAQAATNTQVKDVVFSMSIAGNYQGLKNFLASLERSARIFEVQTITFSSSQSNQNLLKLQSQSQIYNFRLEVKTHSY